MRARSKCCFRVLISAAVLALSAPGASADAKARTKTCAPRGSDAVTRTSAVRVYEVERGDETTLYGCRMRTGRRVVLDTKSDDGYTSSDDYDRVQVAGEQVSWVSTVTDVSCKADCPPGAGTPSVRIGVADLRTRRSRSLPADPIGDAIVLSRTGGVAWLALGAASGTTDVHVSPRAAEDRVIDTGAIDSASLAIEITILSWTRDGVERFARLR